MDGRGVGLGHFRWKQDPGLEVDDGNWHWQGWSPSSPLAHPRKPQAAMELPSGRRRVWSDLLNQACGMLIVWTLGPQFSQGLSLSLTQTGFSPSFSLSSCLLSLSFHLLGAILEAPEGARGTLWRAQTTLHCQKGLRPCPHHWGHSAAAFGSAVDVGLEPQRHTSPSQACSKHLLFRFQRKLI